MQKNNDLSVYLSESTFLVTFSWIFFSVGHHVLIHVFPYLIDDFFYFQGTMIIGWDKKVRF